MRAIFLGALAAVLMAAQPAPCGDNLTTNYFAGYSYVPAAFTNAGDTGLSTGTGYIAFKVTNLVDLATNQADHASASSDVRAVLYGICERYYLAYTASTNKPTTAISKGQHFDTVSNTNVERITHTLRTTRNLAAGTLP